MKHINGDLKPQKCSTTFSPLIKITDIFSFFMKGFIAICILASISLLSYSTFSNHSSQCSEKQQTFIHFSDFLNESRSNTTSIQETNISHIFFGIGGTTKTWRTRRHYCELWWKPNVTRGYVWLDQKPAGNKKWPETSPPYRVSEDTTRFKYTSWYGSRSAIRIARIIKESYELGLQNVRWFVLGDDDTLFFVENLMTILRKYDHNEMYYIGGNSESVEQDDIHSYNMAYGGGGFAISYPLATELVRILDGCIDRYASLYGSDQKIQACISEIGVPVTKELGFHQVDLRGDAYGFLAAHPVTPLVSLHHLDYLQPIFPGLTRVGSVKKLMQPYNVDPGRTLQQTFCYDFQKNWTVSISWGYTVQLYPKIVTSKQLETAFKTFVSWRTWGDGPFTFNTKPMGSKACEVPVIFFMERVGSDSETGRTLIGYVQAAAEGNMCYRKDYVSAMFVQYVNVSADKLDAAIWNKAPRRQCCEIMKGGDENIQVNIRGCRQWESVTPP